jgi:Phage protein Gp138 N-terminal domain
MSATKPLINRGPADNSFANGMRTLMRLNSLNEESMVPAKVISYNRTKNTATVQPMIMQVDVDDNAFVRDEIDEIPVFSFGGGGYHINFPLKAGDLGWILAADRDISQFLQSLSAAKPTTTRHKKFGDSWFVPDVFRQYTINSKDTDSLVIQTTDGTTRIAIKPGDITITTPSTVKIDTPTTTITGDVIIEKTLTVNGNTTLKANLTVLGMTFINGGFNATGGGNLVCTLPQSTTIGGIVVYGHGHIETNAQGGRTSGGMIA